jgi:hypothetical protein
MTQRSLKLFVACNLVLDRWCDLRGALDAIDKGETVDLGDHIRAMEGPISGLIEAYETILEEGKL